MAMLYIIDFNKQTNQSVTTDELENYMTSTRERIIATAVQLFEMQGYHRVTVDQIERKRYIKGWILSLLQFKR